MNICSIFIFQTIYVSRNIFSTICGNRSSYHCSMNNEAFQTTDDYWIYSCGDGY